jgi:hypothetical protein
MGGRARLDRAVHGYAEALFCALAIWALIALLERRWLTAAGLTILAGTVHSNAVALVATVAVAALPALIRAAQARQHTAYTLVIVVLALGTGPYYLGSKPRFLLPAMLLGLPLARLLAPARTWVLIPLIAILGAASTWFSLYLMSIGWAP